MKEDIGYLKGRIETIEQSFNYALGFLEGKLQKSDKPSQGRGGEKPMSLLEIAINLGISIGGALISYLILRNIKISLAILLFLIFTGGMLVFFKSGKEKPYEVVDVKWEADKEEVWMGGREDTLYSINTAYKYGKEKWVIKDFEVSLPKTIK